MDPKPLITQSSCVSTQDGHTR